MLAIIIPAEPAKEIEKVTVPVPSDEVGAWLRKRVDGHLEAVRLTDNRDMWISETGKLDNKPLNRAATGLAVIEEAIAPRDFIAGTAVILAHVGPDTIGLNSDQFLKTWGQLHDPIFQVITRAIV